MEETPEKNTSENKKKLLASNWVLSATALFVSVCTLFILIYQTHLSNKMYYLVDKALKASAMPIIELGTSSGVGYFRLVVSNVGIGPAKVKEVYVRYRDTVYIGDMFIPPFTKMRNGHRICSDHLMSHQICSSVFGRPGRF